jgi:hypothetical protein
LPTPDRIRVVHRSCNSRRARAREREARHPQPKLDDEEELEADAPRRQRPPRRVRRIWQGACGIGLRPHEYDEPAEVIGPDGLVRYEPGRRGRRSD